MINLKSIKEEAAACRRAFKGFKVGGHVVHCHHKTLVETLDEPVEHRILYILTEKLEGEQALRLRLFRPVKKLLYDDYEAKRKPLYDDYLAKHKSLYDDYLAKCEPLYDDYLAKHKPLYDDYLAKCKPLHKIICKVKDCPWDGNTIFPAKGGGGK